MINKRSYTWVTWTACHFLRLLRKARWSKCWLETLWTWTRCLTTTKWLLSLTSILWFHWKPTTFLSSRSYQEIRRGKEERTRLTSLISWWKEKIGSKGSKGSKGNKGKRGWREKKEMSRMTTRWGYLQEVRAYWESLDTRLLSQITSSMKSSMSGKCLNKKEETLQIKAHCNLSGIYLSRCQSSRKSQLNLTMWWRSK